jgi:CRP/FNR family transcriptional regulator
MGSAQEQGMIQCCFNCELRADRLFCDLPPMALEALDRIKYSSLYSRGSVLFVEGQMPSGVFVLCTGRAKLTTRLADGRPRILRVAEPGEMLGLSATIAEKPYEGTAEILDLCQVNFIKREDFMRFLREHGLACLKVAQQLSRDLHTAYQRARALMAPHSASEKLSRLLLEWAVESGEKTEQGIQLKLLLTQEEIAQLIGTSRETVTRLLGDLKSKKIIHLKGPNMVIHNRPALESRAAY